MNATNDYRLIRSNGLTSQIVKLPKSATDPALEAFRVSYEIKHGRTDLSRVYTCSLPLDQQNYLLENHFDHYFDGLPPYMREFIKMKTRERSDDGAIIDDKYAKLILQRELKDIRVNVNSQSR